MVNRPGVAQELRNARGYVDSYDFRQDQGLSPAGAPTFRTMLVVRFVPEAVDTMVAALGLPVWAQPRPKPVLWLAIDDGSGPRLLTTGQVNAARSVLDRAEDRGYRLGLPSGGSRFGTVRRIRALRAAFRRETPDAVVKVLETALAQAVKEPKFVEFMNSSFLGIDYRNAARQQRQALAHVLLVSGVDVGGIADVDGHRLAAGDAKLQTCGCNVVIYADAENFAAVHEAVGVGAGACDAKIDGIGRRADDHGRGAAI